MNEKIMIDKKDAVLYVDINCCRCGKNCALSNTHQLNNHRYCSDCYDIESDNYFDMTGY